MVNSVHKSCFRALALAPAAALACWTMLAPGQVRAQDDPLRVSLDADWSSFDRQTNTMMFRGLRIAQGNFVIQADEAVASDLDFASSRWEFNGNVRITMDTAMIESASAELVFQAHELLLVELQGDPAQFQDHNPERAQPINGGAQVLRYERAERTLRMTGGAWLNEGPNEFRGCDLIYDIDEKKITSGSSECGEPLLITIVPPANDADEP